MISTNPYKGTKDYLPEDFTKQKYIFDTWRNVCLNFGFKEYQTPVLENAQIYKEKSGEDVGNKELYTFTDAGNREVALRPEMTPSVTRLVSKIYKQESKPIKFFSISNFFRYEKPQRGRSREFWQLNADVFGDESINSDVEVLSLAIELMLAFNPPKDSFKAYVNNRILINDLLSLAKINKQNYTEVVRLLDKFAKFSSVEDFVLSLIEKGVQKENTQVLLNFLQSKSYDELVVNVPQLKNSEGLNQMTQLLNSLSSLGYEQYVKFNPSIVRGFDYYDGLIFEFFDMNPNNNRSLFGGGRYNGLSEIFGENNIPAVGFAPGDVPMELFLTDWDLFPEGLSPTNNFYYMPLLIDKYSENLKIANQLRQKGYNIETSYKKVSISNALRDAQKRQISKVILFGDLELQNNQIKIKDLDTSNVETLDLPIQ